MNSANIMIIISPINPPIDGIHVKNPIRKKHIAEMTEIVIIDEKIFSAMNLIGLNPDKITFSNVLLSFSFKMVSLAPKSPPERILKARRNDGIVGRKA